MSTDKLFGRQRNVVKSLEKLSSRPDVDKSTANHFTERLFAAGICNFNKLEHQHVAVFDIHNIVYHLYTYLWS